MEFGENLRALREARGMTQKELAERACASQPMVAQVERGSRSPTLAMAQALATALDVSVAELLYDEHTA